MNATARKSFDRLDALSCTMEAHARECRRCTYPTIDKDGNPGYVGDACPEGADLIRAYRAEEEKFIKDFNGGAR